MLTITRDPHPCYCWIMFSDNPPFQGSPRILPLRTVNKNPLRSFLLPSWTPTTPQAILKPYGLFANRSSSFLFSHSAYPRIRSLSKPHLRLNVTQKIIEPAQRSHLFPSYLKELRGYCSPTINGRSPIVLVRRTHSLAFVLFVRGQFPPHKIRYYIAHMS